MREAWLVCGELNCGTIIKRARCPVCQSLLGYVNEDEAICLYCGVSWTTEFFFEVCPRCNKGAFCSLLKFVKGGKI